MKSESFSKDSNWKRAWYVQSEEEMAEHYKDAVFE